MKTKAESLIAVRRDYVDRQRVNILWNVGKRCNYDCSYCPSLVHDNTSKHIDIKHFQTAMENLSRFYKGKKLHIALTGGEPFVHPKILNILSILREFPEVKVIGVTTNGSVSLQKYEKAIEMLNYIEFSWHFEYTRPEHMKNILCSIQNKLNNTECLVNLMFLPGHLDKMKEIASWLTKNNIRFIIRKIRPLYNPVEGFNLPGSSGMKGVERYHSQYNGPDNTAAEGYYSKDEMECLQSFESSDTTENDVILIYTHKNKGNTQSSFISRSTHVNTLLLKQLNSFANWQCHAGIESLYIDNIGDVFRASCKQGGKQGNIADSFLNLNPKPITCKQAWCNCEGDMKITKWKNGYEHAIKEADDYVSSKESVDNQKKFREFSKAMKNYFYRFKSLKF